MIRVILVAYAKIRLPFVRKAAIPNLAGHLSGHFRYSMILMIHNWETAIVPRSLSVQTVNNVKTKTKKNPRSLNRLARWGSHRKRNMQGIHAMSTPKEAIISCQELSGGG